MGPHPVPQNITTFQFKLVGDMTLKQFLYLAAGAGTAYIIFVFFSTSYPLVSWPLIFIFSLCGVAFAFMPIASRPLDYWVKAFFKATYSQTNFTWSKDRVSYKDTARFNSRYTDFIHHILIDKNPVPAQQIIIQKKPPAEPAIPPVQNIANPAATALPSSDDLKKTVDLAREAQSLQMKIVQTERTLNQIKSAASQPSPIPVNYSEEVNRVLENLQTLVNQASEIKTRMKPDPNLPQKLDAKQFKDKVKVVFPEKQKQTQIALTTFPNVISGIVKNTRGDFVEAVVAVIYDKEGLPVRALKTNKLGQFSGSTPLPNGTYTLELEKDHYSFDVLQILLDGNILPPLTITAKEIAQS